MEILHIVATDRCCELAGKPRPALVVSVSGTPTPPITDRHGDEVPLLRIRLKSDGRVDEVTDEADTTTMLAVSRALAAFRSGGATPAN